MIETIILSITSFISTNIDDMFINMLFFTDVKPTNYKHIIIGKYIGMGLLTGLSLISAFGLQFLPHQYIGYLGILPICLGLKEIITSINNKEESINEDKKQSTNLILNVAFITIANGADNIGIYIPLFVGFSFSQILLTMGIYFILVYVWCILGKLIINLPILRNMISKYKSILVPIVYIALGIYILIKNMI